MDGKFSTPFRHVTGKACFTLWKSSIVFDITMAALANLKLLGLTLFAVRFRVRVMASEACHLALLKTARHAQAIGSIGDFKAARILRPTRIEIEFVIREGLPWPVRENTAIVAKTHV
jgi:hypothetical protein